MRKKLATVTVVAVVLAAAAMVFAAVDTARSSATPSLCHSTKLSISVPSTGTAGSVVKITGSEATTPQHDVTATLQYKTSGSKKWKNGPSTTLNGADFTLNWTPAKKGKYEVRVRVTHLSASNQSSAKKITVK